MNMGEGDSSVVLLNRLSGWLLEEKVAQSLSSNHYPGSPRAYSWGGRSGSSNTTLSHPKFPTIKLLGIPSSVGSPIVSRLSGQKQSDHKILARRAELLALLKKDSEKEEGSDKMPPKPLEAFRGRTAGIKLPILRAMLASALGDEEALPKFVSSVAESNNVDELNLAAGYLWKTEKFVEAYQVLTRLRMLTLSREERKQVDGRLAMVGATLADEKDLEWEREPAQRAALRLRKALTNYNERPALMNVLIKLGLQKEAEKLEASPGSKSRSSLANRSSRRTGVQGMVGLVTDGRKEEAAREAAKLLKTYAKNSNSRYESQRLVETLNKLDLEEDVLAKLHPGESQSLSRRLLYANFALTADRKDLARPFFEALVKERPKHMEARVGLFMSLSKEERNYQDFLKEVDGKVDTDALLDAMSALWSKADDQYDETIAMLDLTEGILKHLKPSADEKRNLSWVPYHLMAATRDTYYNGVRLGNLYGSRENTTLNKEKTAKFDQAAKSVFVEMLNHPQTAEQGFMMLSKARESLKISDEEIVKFAQRALREVIRRKKFVNHSGYGQRDALWVLFQRNGSSSSYSLDDVAGPMDYLISKGENQAVMSDEIMAILKENQPGRFEALELARRITSVEPAEGAKLFTDWYAGLEKGKDDQKRTTDQIAADLVSFARNVLLFDLKPSGWTDDLEKKLIGIRNEQWNDHSGWSDFSGKWLGWVAKHKGREAVEKFVYDVCVAAMGPEERWPILAELGVSTLPQEYRQPMSTLSAKLTGFCLVEEAVLPVMRLATEHEFEKLVENFNVRSAVYQVVRGLKKPEDLVGWFKSSGLKTLSSEGEGGAVVTLGLLGIIEIIPAKADEQAKEMIKKIEALEMDSLIKELIKVQVQALSTSDKAKALAKLWEERTDLLKAMAGKNETFVATRLKGWFPGYRSEFAGPKLKAFLEGLQAGQNEELSKKAKQWLAEGVEIDTNDYQGRKLWVEVIKIAEADANLAGKVVEKIYEAVQTSAYLGRGRASSGGFVRKPLDSWNGYFLEYLVEYGKSVDLITKVKLIDGIYRGPFAEQLLEPATGGNYSYYVRNDVQRALNELGGPKDDQSKKTQLLFSGMAEKLSGKEQSTFVAMVLPALIRNGTISSDDLKEVTKWSNEELRKKSPLLAESLNLFIQMAAANRRSGDERKKTLKTAEKMLVKLIPHLELPTPLAVEFSYGLLSLSHGPNLFAGREQWSWLSEVMSTHPNGMRAIPLSKSLRIFEYLSRLQFPDKTEAAKELMAAVEGTLITPDLLLKFRNQNSNTSWISQLLPLSLAAGDLELAKRLIQQNTRSFRGDLALILDVAGTLDAKMAAKLAPATTMRYRYENLPLYSKSTTATIAKILEALPARDRYRFEVMAASLYDSEVEGDVPLFSRKERLEKLAGRFEKEAPSDNGPRWQVLNIFASDTSLVKLMIAHFQAEASKTNLATALALQSEGGRSTDGSALIKIIKLWLKEEMQAGRPGVMAKQIEILATKIKVNNDYNIRYAGKELTTALIRYLVVESSKSEEKARALLPLSRANMEQRMIFDKGSRDNGMKGVIWGDLFVHVFAGETEAWYARVEKLEKEEKKAFVGPLGGEDRGGVREITSAGVYGAEGRSKERVEFLGKLLGDPLFLEKVMTHYTRLSNFMDAGVVNREELYQVIDGLPGDHSRKAEFLMEKAGVMGWREEKVDEAEKIYEQARELALSRKNDKIAHLSDALHARLLGQKKRISESWKFGKRVDPKHLPEPDQKWFAKDSEKWKEAATRKPVQSEKKLDDPSDQPSKETTEEQTTKAEVVPESSKPIQPLQPTTPEK